MGLGKCPHLDKIAWGGRRRRSFKYSDAEQQANETRRRISLRDFEIRCYAWNRKKSFYMIYTTVTLDFE